jgi:hypothetical protein
MRTFGKPGGARGRRGELFPTALGLAPESIASLRGAVLIGSRVQVAIFDSDGMERRAFLFAGQLASKQDRNKVTLPQANDGDIPRVVVWTSLIATVFCMPAILETSR